MYVVYGTEDCVWCRRAQSLLDAKELPYEYKHFSAYPDDWKWSSVPQIFSVYEDEEKHIGGYNGLVLHLLR